MMEKFSVVVSVLFFIAHLLTGSRGGAETTLTPQSWECGSPLHTDITYKVDLSSSLQVQPNGSSANLLQHTVDHHHHCYKRTSASDALPSSWEDFKIEIVYDNDTINDATFVSPALADLIKNTVMPRVRHFYEGALKVQPLLGPILLDRKCSDGAGYNLFNVSGRNVRACVANCTKETKCGDVTVPDQYLNRCLQCTSANPCTVQDVTETVSAGEGGIKGHFVLFVSVSDKQVCAPSSAVAGYASACQLESQYDRPIAGYITLCKDRISSYSTDNLIALVKHELLHALVFSSTLYPFFRDADNDFEPRTPRDRWGFPPKNAEGFYVPSTDTIREVTYNDWLVFSGTMNHSMKHLVTPNVLDEARAFFNCSTLEGVELENHGPSGTKDMHWEARILGNELMIGSSVCVTGKLSRLTLALMKDSGWYKPNFARAEMMAWGQNEGCRFALGSCHEHIQNQLSAGEIRIPFCHYVEVEGPSCSTDRTYISDCSVTEFSEELPLEYQYFSSSTFGGRYELFDYCPICCESKRTYCEKAPNRLVIDGRSRMSHSVTRCFKTTGEWKHIPSDPTSPIESHEVSAGCYPYECTDHGIIVTAYGTKFHCQCEGQQIFINVTDPETGDVHQGILLCPSCKTMCYDHTDVNEPCKMKGCSSTQSDNVYSPCDLPPADRTCGSRSNCIEERVKNGYKCKCFTNTSYGCSKHFQKN